MVERLRVLLQPTVSKIQKRIEKIDSLFEANGNQAGKFDSDGDTLHDALVYQSIAERERLLKEKARLKGILYENPRIVQPKGLENGTVSIGHQIQVRIKYPDGVKEETCFTLGDTLDKEFEGTADPKSTILSVESPLGQAVLGHKVGDQFEFLSPGGVGTTEVLAVDVSPLLG